MLATPAKWNVFNVIWVPGSPILWAPIAPIDAPASIFFEWYRDKQVSKKTWAGEKRRINHITEWHNNKIHEQTDKTILWADLNNSLTCVTVYYQAIIFFLSTKLEKWDVASGSGSSRISRLKCLHMKRLIHLFIHEQFRLVWYCLQQKNNTHFAWQITSISHQFVYVEKSKWKSPRTWSWAIKHAAYAITLYSNTWYFHKFTVT